MRVQGAKEWRCMTFIKRVDRFIPPPSKPAGRLHNFLSAPANLQWKVKGVRAIANIHSHDFYFYGTPFSFTTLRVKLRAGLLWCAGWKSILLFRVLFFASEWRTDSQPAECPTERKVGWSLPWASSFYAPRNRCCSSSFGQFATRQLCERESSIICSARCNFQIRAAQKMHLLLSERENYSLTQYSCTKAARKKSAWFHNYCDLHAESGREW